MKPLIISVLAVVVVLILVINHDLVEENRALRDKIVMLEFDLAFERDPELSRCIGYVEPSPQMKKIIKKIKMERLRRIANGE